MTSRWYFPGNMGRLLQNFTSLKAQAVGSSSISSWSSTLKNLCESLSVVESDWNPAKRIKEVWFPSPFDTGRAGEGWGGSGVLGTEGVGYTGLQALVKTEASSTFGHLILDSTFFKDLCVLHGTLNMYVDSLGIK